MTVDRIQPIALAHTEWVYLDTMSLEARANSSRQVGSSMGLGGAYSTNLVKGDNRTKEDYANNHAIIKRMAQAQRHGDWVTYTKLQQQLKHA